MGGNEAHNAPTSQPNCTPFFELDEVCPLPYGWERCVDLKSGSIHFVDRVTGIKTDNDPRKKCISSVTTGLIPINKQYDMRLTKSSTQCPLLHKVKVATTPVTHDYPSTSFTSSTSSSPLSSLSFWGDQDDAQESSTNSVIIEPDNEKEMASVIVTVGCTNCFTYMMLSKEDLQCPRCGTASLINFPT